MAHVAKPLHSPDANHKYELNSSGCLKLPNGSQNGVQVISETIPREYIGARIMGSTVESIFFKVRDAVALEFTTLCDLSGRAVARQNFGGSSKLKKFTDRVLVGTLPITPTTIELALNICQDDRLLLADGQAFLMMLLLFGEDVLSEDLPSSSRSVLPRRGGGTGLDLSCHYIMTT